MNDTLAAKCAETRASSEATDNSLGAVYARLEQEILAEPAPNIGYRVGQQTEWRILNEVRRIASPDELQVILTQGHIEHIRCLMRAVTEEHRTTMQELELAEKIAKFIYSLDAHQAIKRSLATSQPSERP